MECTTFCSAPSISLLSLQQGLVVFTIAYLLLLVRVGFVVDMLILLGILLSVYLFLVVGAVVSRRRPTTA